MKNVLGSAGSSVILPKAFMPQDVTLIFKSNVTFKNKPTTSDADT